MQTTKTRGARSRGRRKPFSARNRGGKVRGGFRGEKSKGRSTRKQPTFDPTQFINKNPVEVKEEVYKPTHTFRDFAIDERLKKTLTSLNLKTPSPIQDKAIPEILSGKDLVGLAETGTGKTAAFLLPLIELKKRDVKSITLILAPTRELALQVDAELRKLSKGFKFFSTVCVGGTNIGPQIRQLKKLNQFIIGTPGRVKDLIERGMIRTEIITSVVLDEADRMLDMGFIHDMRSILGDLKNNKQTLFFSATMDQKTAGLVGEFMKNPVTVSVKKKDVTDSIEQDIVAYSHAHKFETLADMLRKDEFRRVIVFGSMKHSVEKLGKELTSNGISSESIHGNKNHAQRQRALNRFKSGQVKVLVATDVAARGIHVDNISHVINYDLPNTFEDYVHRIGRTGRGELKGKALSFVSK